MTSPASPAPSMHAEYVKLIAERDVLLSDLRKEWLAARSNGERSAAMSKLNASLDERSRLMRCRDGALAGNL